MKKFLKNLLFGVDFKLQVPPLKFKINAHNLSDVKSRNPDCRVVMASYVACNHINSLVKQAYIKLQALWSTQLLEVRILIAKTYLIPCDSSSKCKLYVLFNSIARYVYNLRRYDNMSVAFDNLLNICVFLFLHRIINKRIPTYLFDRLRFVQSSLSRNIIVQNNQS